MSLRLIAIGGTFDKVYDPLTGSLGFGRTCLPELLEAARIDPLPPISSLMLVDSLDMGDAHRQTVVSACRHCTEEALCSSTAPTHDKIPPPAIAAAGSRSAWC